MNEETENDVINKIISLREPEEAIITIRVRIKPTFITANTFVLIHNKIRERLSDYKTWMPEDYKELCADGLSIQLGDLPILKINEGIENV